MCHFFWNFHVLMSGRTVRQINIPDSVIIQRYGWVSPPTNISKVAGMVTVVIKENAVAVVGAMLDCRNSGGTD